MKIALGFLLMCVLAIVFSTSVNAGSHVVERGDTLSHIARLYDTTWPVLAEYNALTNPHLIFPRQVIRIPSGLYRVWTVEELGDIIVSAGTFWEDWHIERFRNYLVTGKDGRWVSPGGHSAYAQISPLSGFGSIDDIYDYLLQYFTQDWIDARFSGSLPPFVGYSDMLFIFTPRAGGGNTRWNNVSHVLVEQEGTHAVVQTTALHANWSIVYGLLESGSTMEELMEWGSIPEVIYTFTFINGQINHIVSSLGFSTPFAIY